MGAEESKRMGGSCSLREGCSSCEFDCFPNMCRKELETTAWTLLHQCSLEKWNEGQSDESGFPGVPLRCSGLVHKDCSLSFCMSHQGIVNINRSVSIFSFRKRSKFAKMAEHFEYNHIPAQMSSINHFHVKSVVCYCERFVVLHLARSTNSQFGLLDLHANKFLGIFGKQSVEYPSEALVGHISPDQTRCLIRFSRFGPQCRDDPFLHLYDLTTKELLKVICPTYSVRHFCFDPRFTWNRVAVSKDCLRRGSGLDLVQVESWQAVASDARECDARPRSDFVLKDLCYSHDGCFVFATMLDADAYCYCHEKKLRSHRPRCCSVYVSSGDTAETLIRVSFYRYVCARHNCPVNYKPAFSVCGSRVAFVQDLPPGQSATSLVQVYKLPSPLSLQYKCRVAILQNFRPESITNLPLPQKLINYLLFKPEFY